MAILNGLIQKMKGSAGQLTFKSLNGQTVVSERHAYTNAANSYGGVNNVFLRPNLTQK